MRNGEVSEDCQPLRKSYDSLRKVGMRERVQ